MRRSKRYLTAMILMIVFSMLIGLCACNESKPGGGPPIPPSGQQEDKPAEGFDLLQGYWISNTLTFRYEDFDGELNFEKDGKARLNSGIDGTWRIENGLLYIDDGGALRGEVCYEFQCDGEKTLTLYYMPGTAEEKVNTYCHRPEVISSTTRFQISKSDAEVEKLYQELSQKLVGDWENLRPTFQYYWDYLRIRSDGSISVQASSDTYDTDWYFDKGYFCFKTNGFENKYNLYMGEDYMTLHTDAGVSQLYNAYYNKVGGETEGAIIPSGTHMYYAPEDFDESTATTSEAAIYLDGRWRLENGVTQPNFPDSIEMKVLVTSNNGQNSYSYEVYLDGNKDRGAWFLDKGKIGFSFDSLYKRYYDYELSGERLTLSRSFTDGSSGSVTYIRD